MILNDFRGAIEQHNAELVSLLMQKDELENEQDSMLMDMEDIQQDSMLMDMDDIPRSAII